MKTSLIKNTLIAAALALGSLGSSAQAAPITIPNGSFESAWDFTGGGVGNWTIGANFVGQTAAVGGLNPTNGSFFAFVNGPDAGGPGFTYQRLGSPGGLQAGTYTFTLDIGLRNDVGSSGYDVAFYAVDPVLNVNNATLARDNTTVLAVPGWNSTQFQFSLTGNESYFATDVIQIVLGTSTGVQIGFDTVQGNFVPIPEPSTWALMGLALFFVVAMRRRQMRKSESQLV